MAGLLRPVPHADDLHLGAVRPFGPQRLVEAARIRVDQAGRGGQNLRGGAIILLQLDHLGAGKILLEPQDIGHLRAAPAVDRLIVIADHADILARLRYQPQPEILHGIGVLIFVHHDIFEAALIALQHILVRLQNHQIVQQQIAEIAGVERFQPILIGAVHHLALAIGKGLILACIEIGRGQALVLPAIEQRGEAARGPALFVQIGLADQLFQQAQLIVGIDDGEVRFQPDQFGMAAQHLGADGVKGAEPRHALHRIADHAAHPLTHFPRRLVGEGDRQDLARPGQAAVDDMRQPRGERCRLARTRARQHQQRAVSGHHRFALGRVERADIGRRSGIVRGGGIGGGKLFGHREQVGNAGIIGKRRVGGGAARAGPCGACDNS